MPNNFEWHLLIYSEDDATRQIGNGMSLKKIEQYSKLAVKVQSMNCAKGWADAVEKVKKNSQLKKYPKRRILLIIDFDNDCNRLQSIKDDDFFKMYADRIFIVGAFDEAERLKKICNVSNLEKVGERLAEDCHYWEDPLLQQCKDDACRLKKEIDDIINS